MGKHIQIDINGNEFEEEVCSSSPSPCSAIDEAWGKYHGPIDIGDGETYIPQTPPIFIRGFVDGYEHSKSEWSMLTGIELGIRKLGYRLSRGTWQNANGEEIPTLNIDRPDDPTWGGVWSTIDDMDELSVAMLLFTEAHHSWGEYEDFKNDYKAY